MRILVIDRPPLGAAVDTFELCKFATRSHSVTCLNFDRWLLISQCQDEKHPISVERIVVPAHASFVVRTWRWFRACFSEVAKRYDIIYVYYFPFCSALLLVSNRSRVVLDIRTSCVHSSPLARCVKDLLTTFDALWFKQAAVITEGVRKRLHIWKRKVHIVPIGADAYHIPRKSFDGFHLLYVGHFFRARRLATTIRAFARLFALLGTEMQMSYTMAGGTEGDEADMLKRVALEVGVSSVMRFPGPIPHHRIAGVLCACNFGMAYVPITSYFEYQPPTKTFEYLMAGLPVLATGTKANRALISDRNGIVTGDSEDDVFNGLKKLIEVRSSFDSDEIRRSVEEHTWERIMAGNCIPYLERIASLADLRDPTRIEAENEPRQ